MKKTILIILLSAGLYGCSPDQTVTKKNLPIEVVQLKEAGKFDTLQVIQTEKTVYQFKGKEYVGAYAKENNVWPFFWLGVVFGVFITGFVFAILPS